jgi:UDP-N-acetylmuramoyl-tripeptide--D-alanyl-D-alanine ligase
MIKSTLGKVAEVTGSKLINVDANTSFFGVCTDSREIQVGELFVCLTGERFNGADFAQQAIARGAAAVLSSRHIEGVPLVLAPNGELRALQELATWYRGTLNQALVVGITGSAGKTLTKDFIAQILRSKGEVVATNKSQNNEIGLPLTVLRADDRTKFLVLEMGARRQSDIATLVGIADPQVSVVTNVGLAHIEIFGSLEGTQQAKSEILQKLDPNDYAVLNADDERVMAMKSVTNARCLTFGEAATADFRFENVVVSPTGTTSFDLLANKGLRALVTFNLSGRYLASNAAAAAAVGSICGVGLTDAATALSQVMAHSPHRAAVIQAKGFLVIDDSYNANPEAMLAALAMLKEVAGTRRKVAVIGDMRELGSESKAQHQRMGSLLGDFGVDVLVAVGAEAKGYVAAAPKGLASYWAPDSKAAMKALSPALAPNDVVLVKASRAIGLDDLVAKLLNEVDLKTSAGNVGGRLSA